MSSSITGGPLTAPRPTARRSRLTAPSAPKQRAEPDPARSERGSLISVVRLKQAAVRLTERAGDDAAWDAAEAVTNSVDRWVWAAAGAQLGRISRSHRGLDPVVAEHALLDESPESPRDEEQYGLDGDGQVVAQRSWIGGSGSLRYAYLRQGSELLIHRWDAAGERAGIELVHLAPDGRLLYTVDINADGECFAERYAWDGKTLQAVELLVVTSSDRPQARRVRVTDRFVYGER